MRGRERERGRMGGREGEPEWGEEEREKLTPPLSREPDTGLAPRTPGS